MIAELLAEVTRGGWVESRHFGHVAVVDSAGRLLFSAGDPDHPTFPRSSLKPLQGVAALEHGVADAYGLSDTEIAVMCASHQAEPRHREAVARILEKIGAAESDLRCGPHTVGHAATRTAMIRQGVDPTPIFNNCSGKHAGMLALARKLDAPLAGYWEHDHPVQRSVQGVLTTICGVAGEELGFGIDGCGVPTYLMPLQALAFGFARLADPDTLPAASGAAARRVVSAMTSEPGMVSGEGRMDTRIMSAFGGRVMCKGGAEGCEAAALVGRGIGIAIKTEDGEARPLAPVLLALLRPFEVCPPDGEGGAEGWPASLDDLASPRITNTRGETVGEVRAVLG